jgi:hypothetical protein
LFFWWRYLPSHDPWGTFTLIFMLTCAIAEGISPYYFTIDKPGEGRQRRWKAPVIGSSVVFLIWCPSGRPA